MKRKLFLTLGLAALAMYSYGAKKLKTTARKMNKTTVQQPTFTEWHDLQVNEINRLPLHTSFFTYPFDDMVYEEGGVVKSSNLSSVDKTMSQNSCSRQLGTQRLWSAGVCEHRLCLARTFR